jgi:hypothetical protein
MHTIRYNRRDGFWTAGYFEPNADDAGSRWVLLRDFTTQERAERYVHYLNGGSNDEVPPGDED